MSSLLRRFCEVMLAVIVSVTGLAKGEELTVFAAASMTESLQEAAKIFEEETSIKVKYSFGASGTLSRQITEGAPVGFFISAAPKWTKELKEKGFLLKDEVLAMNELVLVSGQNADIHVEFAPEFVFAAAFKGKLSLGEPQSVPAGKYAQEALKKLGWWEGVKDRLVLSKDVRETMRVVEMGGADLGVVYKTDALVSKEVKIVGVFPAGTHAPITYTMGPVKGSGEAAEKFGAFLLTEKVAAIFAKQGFLPTK